MGDRELLQLLREEPEQGVRQLMEQYAGLTYAIVNGRAGGVASPQDVEECVSDVIFEIYRRRESIDPEKGTLKAFLSVVARQRAVNLFRKKEKELRRSTGGPVPEDAADGAGSEEAVIGAEERRQLLAAVKRLGEPDSAIIVRRYYFGQSSREIAADLGLTPGAVDTRLSRAMGKLRELLKGGHDGQVSYERI